MSAPPDPFRAGPDVAAYVRNAEFEQSSEYLAAKLVDAPTWVGICGPAGVGKTLLARLLLRRLAPRFTVAHAPACDLAPAELERWIAAQVRAKEDTLPALATRLARAGRPLLVAFDEAQRASGELLAWLGTWCNAECGGRAVLVWTEGDGVCPLAALARCPTRVFVEPLTLAEVPAYVEAHLARVGATPEQRAALGGRTLERIALASRGIPREIQRLADAELVTYAWRHRDRSPRAASAPRGGSEAAARSAAPPRAANRAWLALLLALAAASAALVFLR